MAKKNRNVENIKFIPEEDAVPYNELPVENMSEAVMNSDEIYLLLDIFTSLDQDLKLSDRTRIINRVLSLAGLDDIPKTSLDPTKPLKLK